MSGSLRRGWPFFRSNSWRVHAPNLRGSRARFSPVTPSASLGASQQDPLCVFSAGVQLRLDYSLYKYAAILELD